MIPYLNFNEEEGTIEIRLEDFLFIFPGDIKYEIFNEPGSYAGFNLCDRKYEYEILDGLMGLRLLITSIDPNMTDTRDMPLHKGTIHFLPDFIKSYTVEDRITEAADKISATMRDYK